jgi:hypothetical protein
MNSIPRATHGGWRRIDKNESGGILQKVLNVFKLNIMATRLTIIALGAGGFSVRKDNVELFKCTHQLESYVHLCEALYDNKVTLTQAEIILGKLRRHVAILPQEYLLPKRGMFTGAYQLLAETARQYEEIRNSLRLYREYGDIVQPEVLMYPHDAIAVIVYDPVQWRKNEFNEVYIHMGISPGFSTKEQGFETLNLLAYNRLVTPTDFDRLESAIEAITFPK